MRKKKKGKVEKEMIKKREKESRWEKRNVEEIKTKFEKQLMKIQRENMKTESEKKTQKRKELVEKVRQRQKQGGSE